MIGYHYTTYSNWRVIQREGLKPYLIKKPELEPHFPGGVNGIWIWQNNFSGLSHAGSIIYQVQKGDIEIVKLQLRYDEESILKSGVDTTVTIYHSGTIGNLEYHNGERGVIYMLPIPPKDIKLLNRYNIVRLLQ